MDFSKLEESVWDRLSSEKRPIVLYGMGDGADKILRQFELRGIKIQAVFASDGFVRGHSFHGFRVQRFDEVLAEQGRDLVIVISFASQRPEVLARMYALDAQFDVVAPDVPVAGETLFDTEFVQKEQDRMEAAYALMADDTARRVFLDVIRFKLSGRLQYLRDSETDKHEAFVQLLRPHQHEKFVDLGAYTGDTIRELLSYTQGAYDSIVALEPDARNFRKLCAYAEEQLKEDVELLQAGAWNQDTTCLFASRAGRQSRVSKQGKPVQMRALDSVLDGRDCTMLKMDVEGAEKQAIEGAAQTIAQFHPALNIAAYHRSEDFFALPLQIQALCPTYRMYLRHHPYVPCWDTNLYAVYDR